MNRLIASGSLALWLVVTNPAATAGPEFVNIVGDGSFEIADGSWNITGWTAGRCSGLTCLGDAGSNFASDGSWWIWVGVSSDSDDVGFAFQVLEIPTDATTLHFDVLSQATGCGDSTLYVDIDGGPVEWQFDEDSTIDEGECDTSPPFEYDTVAIDLVAGGFNDGAAHTITLFGHHVPAPSGDQLANWFFDNFRIEVPDSDADGVADSADNCIQAANSDQRDSNADGIGNRCDPDLDNDCAVNFPDLNLMKEAFFSSDPDADLDGSGSVNFADLDIMKQFFFGSPGPSATGC